MFHVNSLIKYCINTLKKEKEEMNDKYPWFNQDNERRNMLDTEILEKCVDLKKSCLSDWKRNR